MRTIALLSLLLTLWRVVPCKAQPQHRQRLIDSLELRLSSHRAHFGDDTTTVQILYDLSLAVSLRDPRERDIYGRQVADISSRLNYTRGIALAKIHAGSMEQDVSNYKKALALYSEATRIANSIGAVDVEVLALCEAADMNGVLGNIGSALELSQGAHKLALSNSNDALIVHSAISLLIAYSRLQQYDKALSYGKLCIELSTKTADLNLLFEAYSAYFGFANDTSTFREYSGKALQIAKDEGWRIREGATYVNMGWMELDRRNVDKAEEFFQRSLEIAEELHFDQQLVYATSGLASAYFDKHEFTRAIPPAIRSMELCHKYRFPNLIVQNASILSECFARKQEYKKAYAYMDTVRMYSDTLVNSESINKTSAIQVQAETDKKNSEIAIVERDRNYQTYLRNSTIVGLLLVMIIALLLWRGYRLRKKSDEANQELILNVLPAAIAVRLKAGERSIADKFDSVSILFADIVDFTQLSRNISAEELVDLLNRIFSAFDDLANKYQLEKIKTIGDCYMVISGAPEARPDHSVVMAKMALEMVETLKQFTVTSTLDPIHIRIGIHTGNVVAGVIGKKKFAYDLWGDAVNTASRMESHGEAGRIHVSLEFKNHFTQAISSTEVSSDSFPMGKAQMWFTERGEIEIKGKGNMKTYFLVNA